MGEEKKAIMSEIPEHYTSGENKSGAWQIPAIAILALVALGGLFFAWSTSSKLDATKQSVSDQVKAVQQSTQQDVSALKDRLAQDEKANADLQGDLKVVTDKLKITQGQLRKARTEAAKQNTETSQKLSALDTSVHSELATKATTDDVKTVDTKVTAVSEGLAKTNNDLNMARSELGNLIARNHDEIDVLRRMGERDYVEFTIAGKNKPQKIGNITVELKGVNEKHNRANIIVVLEDKKLEEKNRNINSPVILYPTGQRQAEELVINKVGKNTITGYLSMPKSMGQSTTSASTDKSGK
jgi:septal ring factor EnvC (AmiA/AmiB activator)